MKKTLIALLLLGNVAFAQSNSHAAYIDTIKAFQKNYIDTHEVVKGEDRKYLQFFAPDETYKVLASFEKLNDVQGFSMPTSTKAMQQYYKYGRITFKINHHLCHLFVYQSKDLMSTKDYGNYLFIPFTDPSNGVETYEGGKYIDLTMQDIKNNTLEIDFNKAYNPYCCYVAGYSCPIPPKENALEIPILAGEKKYTKPVH
ncbi:DUF1684 domain-containing protein [Ferruginibacter paludis]|uniref:DUF1684 domain-containing protein n=1 Tax=Ferruginibacter paludis TaxID=1310417 RepID=UPI0025B44DAF|nr:DUF1684 domain-containing protein [Ferruginibacter paludis]MDN3654172.1 DUF1684 domain-containing protein [Ferruginibacter paludis]